MGKYLKMADVFDGEVKAKHIDEEAIVEIVNGEDSGKNWSIEDSRYWLAMSYEHAGYAVHAINSHDELVAEVERLRESLKWAVGNLPFENAFEWSDDENADAHYAALRLLGVEIEE